MLGGRGVADVLTWMTGIVRFIAGFHCFTTIKTIQQIKSRIKDEKEDEHSNSVAKIQVCAMFRVGDIRKNVWRRHVCVPLRGTNMAAGS